MRGRVKPGIELKISYFETMLKYRFFQKLKLLGNDEFDHFTIFLTMSIKRVIESMTLDRIEWRKRIHMIDPN